MCFFLDSPINVAQPKNAHTSQYLNPFLPIVTQMIAGRPKRLRLDPDNPGPIIEEVTSIDDRGRVHIPKSVVSEVEWLVEVPLECLIVLSEPGQIILLPWMPFAEEVIKNRSDLLKLEPLDEKTLHILRYMEHRYHRLPIPRDWRPTLPPQALLHSNLPEHTRSRVYLTKVGGHIELTSPEHQNHLNKIFPPELTGLP